MGERRNQKTPLTVSLSEGDRELMEWLQEFLGASKGEVVRTSIRSMASHLASLDIRRTASRSTFSTASRGDAASLYASEEATPVRKKDRFCVSCGNVIPPRRGRPPLKCDDCRGSKNAN